MIKSILTQQTLILYVSSSKIAIALLINNVFSLYNHATTCTDTVLQLLFLE